MIGSEFKVLDKGLIKVVDVMGDDSAIVQAARVSYGKGTKTVMEDRGLIRYLMRNRHTSPFEMAELKLLIRCPMDVWRQWIRHRTASVNEYSTRYSEAISDRMETAPNAWRRQAKDNKQGSSGFLPEVEDEADTDGADLSADEARLHRLSDETYRRRLDAGVAREQARKDLPLSTYTEAYWKIDLHNLLHFLALRMDPHAQLEIRAYADVIGREIVAKWVPLTWEAFLDYRLGAVSFSRQEIALLRARLAGDKEKEAAIWRTLAMREQREFEEKLK